MRVMPRSDFSLSSPGLGIERIIGIIPHDVHRIVWMQVNSEDGHKGD